MHARALQPHSAWAEDRATQRCDPSAVPGAKTDGAARGRPVLHTPHRDWHPSDKPSQQDAATALAGCPSQLANTDRSTFQFPLNQDRIILSISGFTEGAKNGASVPKTPRLLLDHSHLYLALTGAMTFADVMKRVGRHASQEGVAYLPATKFGG